MPNSLKKYIPENAWSQIRSLLNHKELTIKITGKRKTKHGDFRATKFGRAQISINSTLNPYMFLITLIHELAHFETHKKYGNKIKPHGTEWKTTFRTLFLPFLNPEVFPTSLLPLLARHIKNPPASTSADAALSIALIKLNENAHAITLISDLDLGAKFEYNQRVYSRSNRRVKRYACVEIKTGKTYLFSPHVEVTPIKN